MSGLHNSTVHVLACELTLLTFFSHLFFLPFTHLCVPSILICACRSVRASSTPRWPSYSAQRKYTLPLLPQWVKMVTKHPQLDHIFTVHLSERVFFSLFFCFLLLLSNDVCNAGCWATCFWLQSDKLSCQFSLVFLSRVWINKQCDRTTQK